MKLNNYINKTIKNIDYQIPKLCPHCNTIMVPEIIDSHSSDNPSAQTFDSVLLAQCTYCNKFYVLPYRIIDRNLYGTGFVAEYTPYPNSINIDIDLPQEVINVSPDFVEIIKQTLQAEKSGLYHIAGMGYRKSVEFLIKDYLIYLNPDEEESIAKLHLGQAISRLDNDKVKNLAKASNILANDQVHYVVKHPSKNIDDVKRFITTLVHYIAMEISSKNSENFLNSI